MPPTAIETGYREARSLRRDLGLADIQPADPDAIAKDRGLIVVRRPFDARRVSGLHLYLKNADVAIAFINNTDTSLRQRFTLAHEIAHNIFDREDTIVDFLDGASSGNLCEIRANCFAGELLMPGAAIRQWQPRGSWSESPQDVATLALHYGVSYEATLYRLKSAEILSDSDIQHLKLLQRNLDSTIRSRLAERGDEMIVLPDEFIVLARQALEAKVISRGKYEELIQGLVTQ